MYVYLLFSYVYYNMKAFQSYHWCLMKISNFLLKYYQLTKFYNLIKIKPIITNTFSNLNQN